MRGQPVKVAHVRTLFGRTKLEASAYLVESADAQSLQDSLSRLSLALEHASLDDARTHAMTLETVYARLLRIDLKYEEWSILDSLARKIERDLLRHGAVSARSLPIDRVADAISSEEADARSAEIRPNNREHLVH